MNRRGFKIEASDDLTKLADHHSIILLAIDAGKTYAQIAADLGIPQGTVKSRISRARKALEKQRASQ